MGALSRADATRGAEQRLAATVQACPGLTIVPIPDHLLTERPPGGERVLRGGRLPDLGDAADEVFTGIAELWEHAGCRVDRTGHRLVVEDPAGYWITLAGPGDPVLTVASPPVAAQLVDRAVLAGVAAGAGLGCLGPCLFRIGPLASFPALALWAWVPLFLMVGGGSLWLPETRRFGIGLLISGAVLGTTVAVVFA